jgi:hypothetical protein
MLECAERFPRDSGDLGLIAALRLFLREEQRHSKTLARFLQMENAPCLRRHWIHSVFRWLRGLAGLVNGDRQRIVNGDRRRINPRGYHQRERLTKPPTEARARPNRWSGRGTYRHRGEAEDYRILLRSWPRCSVLCGMRSGMNERQGRLVERHAQSAACGFSASSVASRE